MERKPTDYTAENCYNFLKVCEKPSQTFFMFKKRNSTNFEKYVK